MAEDNTPTNVVGEGIELYHSISKGQTVNKNLHAGTYNAALDRASQFYGGEQLYKIANDNLNFIQEQANDLVSELSEQVSFEKVEDFYEVTDGMVTREITITLPTGVEADFNIVAETSNNDLTVKFQDLDGYDGAEIYSETLWDIENEPNSLKSSTSTINIIDDENVAEGLLDEIGLKSQAGDFNLRNGYDLYKVNINPSANVVNIPNTAIFVENGIKKEMSSDFIQGFIERPETINQYKNVEQIIIDGKSYDITDSFTSAQALQEHFKDADVLVYINDIEDVGSKSYIFMNENSYVLEKINDAQFNTDVANKYIKNNPYETISKLAREEAFTEPERYQVLLDALLNETDTPTNVVGDLAKQNELINNFVNSMKTEGNLEFYVKHSGTKVPASSIQYNPRIGKGSQIPGFYTEPLGIRDIKVMGGSGGTNAISNYYKVQVNSNNLLISAGGGKVTGLKSPISTVGNANLGNEIEKINWKIFEQETDLSWENDFNGKGLFSVERGEKVFSSNSQGFINYLKKKGLTDDQISSALRKSGIEGFVSGPTNAQYEVVLLDPNDELGIGKNINVQDATETDFVNNQSKVNQIDELITDTPTNVVDDGPALLETRMKIKTQDPEDFGAPGDEIDERVTGWDDDVVKPNKIFAPSKMETNRNYIAQGQKFPSGEDVLNAIKAGTATDEDITRFFIYVASKSPNTIYAGKPMNNADAIADIAKIGIFGDIPIKDLIPLGGKDPYLESEFNLVLDNNQTLSSYDRTIILDMVNEKGQFANLKERMRNVLLDAHNKIYTENANDYFILWRGGNLSRFNTWQSFSKQPETAAMISYQINMSGVGQGGGLNAYVINKNNMIDLDSLGLAHGREKEIIVLTEAANKPGAKLANSLEKAEELRNYQDSWELRKTIPEFVDTFPKEGFVVENISTQLNQLGQDTQNFFNDLISGMNPDLKPNKPYEQIIELNNPQLQNAQDIYNKYVAQGGDFNPHYFTSIPTVYETQIVKAQALSNMLDKHDKVINDTGTIKVLDIGGTEGVWGNTLAEIGDEKIYVEIIDPSPVANNLYNKMQTPVNSRFRHEAFSYVIEDQGRFFNDRKMIRFAEFFAGGTKDNTTGLRNPNVQVQGGKYDVVHEAMAFQFVDKNRQAQIDFIADNVLADDGILFIEEKFRNVDAIYNNNENLKDAFKRNYYTDEQINSKYQNIVGPMGDKQVSVQEIENILGNRFKYVNQYWDSGNFKGYIASNNPLSETFVDEIHALDTSLTNHRFSTAPTQEELKYAVQKDMRNRGIDLELAKDFAKRFVESNKDFVQKTSDALGEVYKGAKAVGPAAGALGLRGLAKVAPVLAPGDVLVEGALGKVTPYIDDFAKRLGFASLPVKQVLPTYIAADIGAAGAELVSAAMYAYDESQRKAPQQPSQFQESLTKFLLPRELEEEAVQKLQIPQDLQSFYRTPAGEKFLEDNDFGSLFKKQLEQEKLTKYSPGWQLSKAIFSLFGSMGSENSSSEPVYSFDQATEKIGQ